MVPSEGENRLWVSESFPPINKIDKNHCKLDVVSFLATKHSMSVGSELGIDDGCGG